MILATTLLALTVAKASPVDPPEPTQIEKTFESLNLKSTTVPGFIQVQFSISETTRKQWVQIRTAPESYRSLQQNEVFSMVWESKNPPSNEKLIEMFLDPWLNGGMVLDLPSEKNPTYRLRFRINVNADIAPDRLKKVMQTVAATGDSLEKKFGGEGDIF
jgi:hypothetical protein